MKFILKERILSFCKKRINDLYTYIFRSDTELNGNCEIKEKDDSLKIEEITNDMEEGSNEKLAETVEKTNKDQDVYEKVDCGADDIKSFSFEESETEKNTENL